MELRPLGFGGIFDRAVTLYIKNFVAFVAIVMVMIVPLAISQYVIDLASQPEFDAFVWIFEHPGATPARIPTVFDSRSSVIALIVTLLISYFLAPFVMNAVAVGVARVYRGRPVEFRACYDAVLRRWKQILGILGMELLILLGWYVATVVVIVLGALAIVAIATAIPALGVALGAIGIIVGLAVMLLSLAPIALALEFAMYAAVIEERGIAEALNLGFTRIFNRVEFWRAVLFAIAAGITVLGASSMFSLLAMLFGVLHLTLLEDLIQTIPNAVITPFGIVLLAVYYFDVRIRNEAYDLEVGLERLTAPQPA
ncbi:MAG TPA: hypothetical protein VKE42_12565 [Candidatus Cybelea sp.]|nr:hypothetical protein [Candidatus Cybelea sp.]